MSGAFTLECSRCGAVSDAMPLAALCAACGSPQVVRYAVAGEGPRLASTWSARARGMWRFRELLPLRRGEDPVSLGEGDTPLLELPRTGAELGVRILVKDEGGNPTGSFKDRGLSAAVTRAAHDGAERLVLPSAGNAGVALAAYAARAGVSATIFLPEDTPRAVVDRCEAYGADLRAVAGLISDCGGAAAAYARETGAFDLATLREPYRIEGKKTMALEVLEALDWTSPDAVIYPTGGGTGLIGTWKALQETAELGLIDAPATRMYAVQSTGCAPVVRAWATGEEAAAPWTDARTGAWGLRVPSARGDRMMLGALRASGGGAVAVPDGAMRTAAAGAARVDGVALGIEGGATLAGLRALLASCDVKPGETVLLFNTGNLANYGWYT